MENSLPKYPAVHDADIAIIKKADPELLAAVHAVLFSGHAGGPCEAGNNHYCYYGACLKFSWLLRGIDAERSAA